MPLRNAPQQAFRLAPQQSLPLDCQVTAQIAVDVGTQTSVRDAANFALGFAPQVASELAPQVAPRTVPGTVRTAIPGRSFRATTPTPNRASFGYLSQPRLGQGQSKCCRTPAGMFGAGIVAELASPLAAFRPGSSLLVLTFGFWLLAFDFRPLPSAFWYLVSDF